MFATVVFAAVVSPALAPSQERQQDPWVVSGVLVERVTGQPMQGRKLGLGAGNSTTSDAQGHFRFELQSPVDEVLTAEREFGKLLGLKEDGEDVRVRLSPETKVLDLGNVSFTDTRLVERVFAASCRSRETPPVVPRVDLLVFQLSSQDRDQLWRADFSRGRQLEARWVPPAKTILCIEENAERVGTYGAFAAAFRVNWIVRVIRLDGGEQYCTELSSDPPAEGDTIRGARGDNMPALVEWLNGGTLASSGCHAPAPDEPPARE